MAVYEIETVVDLSLHLSFLFIVSLGIQLGYSCLFLHLLNLLEHVATDPRNLQ